MFLLYIFFAHVGLLVHVSRGAWLHHGFDQGSSRAWPISKLPDDVQISLTASLARQATERDLRLRRDPTAVYMDFVAFSNDTSGSACGLEPWESDVLSGTTFGASAAVSPNGTVISVTNNNVHAFSLWDGSLVWKTAYSETFGSAAPAVDEDGTVFVSSQVRVRALRGSDGSELWAQNYHRAMGPIVDSAGDVYIATSGVSGSFDKRFYKLARADGAELWSRNMGGSVGGSLSVVHAPSLFADETRVGVGVNPNELFAVNADDSSMVWNVDLSNTASGGTVPSPDGATLVWSQLNNIVAFDGAGVQKWLYARTGFASNGHPVFDFGGRVHLAGYEQKALALDAASGNLLWVVDIPHHLNNAGVLDPDRRSIIYVLSDGRLVSYRVHDGSLRTDTQLPGITNTYNTVPAALPDRTLVVHAINRMRVMTLPLGSTVGIVASGDGLVQGTDQFASFLVYRSGLNTSLACTVQVVVVGGNATLGADYHTAAQTVTFAADVTEKYVRFEISASRPYPDNKAKDTVFYSVRLENLSPVWPEHEAAPRYACGRRNATVTIVPHRRVYADTPYPRSGADHRNTGAYGGGAAGSGVPVRADPSWNADLALGSPIAVRPLVLADGYFFVVASSGRIARVNPHDGAVVWSLQTNATREVEPCLAEDGVVLLAASGGSVVAINGSAATSEAAMLWEFYVPGVVGATSGCVVGLVGEDDNGQGGGPTSRFLAVAAFFEVQQPAPGHALRVFAANATGQPYFEHVSAAAGPCEGAPSFLSDGTVLTNLRDKTVRLAAGSGAVLWTHTIAGVGVAARNTPAVSFRDQLAIVAADNGKLTALHLADGSLAWERDGLATFALASPIVVGGIVFLRGLPPGPASPALFSFFADNGQDFVTVPMPTNDIQGVSSIAGTWLMASGAAGAGNPGNAAVNPVYAPHGPLRALMVFPKSADVSTLRIDNGAAAWNAVLDSISARDLAVTPLGAVVAATAGGRLHQISPGSVVGFASISVSANEDDVVAVVTVARSGLTTAFAAVEVNISAVNGTAHEGVDFLVYAGSTLEFAVGQATAQVTIAMATADGFEGTESFVLRIAGVSTTDPSGARISTSAGACTVTIIDTAVSPKLVSPPATGGLPQWTKLPITYRFDHVQGRILNTTAAAYICSVERQDGLSLVGPIYAIVSSAGDSATCTIPYAGPRTTVPHRSVTLKSLDGTLPIHNLPPKAELAWKSSLLMLSPPVIAPGATLDLTVIGAGFVADSNLYRCNLTRGTVSIGAAKLTVVSTDELMCRFGSEVTQQFADLFGQGPVSLRVDEVGSAPSAGQIHTMTLVPLTVNVAQSPPVGAPEAPSIVTEAFPVSGSVTVTWPAPATAVTGGYRVTSFEVDRCLFDSAAPIPFRDTMLFSAACSDAPGHGGGTVVGMMRRALALIPVPVVGAAMAGTTSYVDTTGQVPENTTVAYRYRFNTTAGQSTASPWKAALTAFRMPRISAVSPTVIPWLSGGDITVHGAYLVRPGLTEENPRISLNSISQLRIENLTIVSLGESVAVASLPPRSRLLVDMSPTVPIVAAVHASLTVHTTPRGDAIVVGPHVVVISPPPFAATATPSLMGLGTLAAADHANNNNNNNNNALSTSVTAAAITITGFGFAPIPTTVNGPSEPLTFTLAGVPCATTRIVNDSVAVCTPPGVPLLPRVGLVIVDAGPARGSSTFYTVFAGGTSPTFEFFAPQVTSIIPAEGPLTGGTRVTVRGSRLVPAEGAVPLSRPLSELVNVSIGGAVCSQVALVPEGLACDTPRGAVPGPVAVVVTTLDGGPSSFDSDPFPPAPTKVNFTYAPGSATLAPPADTAPSVFTVTPELQPLAGGFNVTVVGQGFRWDALVTVAASTTAATASSTTSSTGISVAARVLSVGFESNLDGSPAVWTLVFASPSRLALLGGAGSVNSSATVGTDGNGGDSGGGVAGNIIDDTAVSDGYGDVTVTVPAMGQSRQATTTATGNSAQTATAVVVAERALFYTDFCRSIGRFGRDLNCFDCPPGGYCPGGNRIWPIEGYWNPGEESGFVVECEPRLRCRGGRTSACSRGYTGFACSQCVAGYTALQGGLCVVCPSNSGVIAYILADVAVWLLVSTSAWLMRDSEGFQRTVQFVAVLQDSAQFGSLLSSDMPTWTLRTYDALKLFLGDYEVLKTDCLGNRPAYELQFATRIGHNVLILVVMEIGCVLVGLVRRWATSNPNRKEKLRRFYKDRCVRVTTTWLQLSYINLTVYALGAIVCVRTGAGLRVAVEPSEFCFTGPHTAVFAASIVLLVTVGVVWPIWYAVFLARSARTGPGSIALGDQQFLAELTQIGVDNDDNDDDNDDEDDVGDDDDDDYNVVTGSSRLRQRAGGGVLANKRSLKEQARRFAHRWGTHFVLLKASRRNFFLVSYASQMVVSVARVVLRSRPVVMLCVAGPALLGHALASVIKRPHNERKDDWMIVITEGPMLLLLVVGTAASVGVLKGTGLVAASLVTLAAIALCVIVFGADMLVHLVRLAAARRRAKVTSRRSSVEVMPHSAVTTSEEGHTAKHVNGNINNNTNNGNGNGNGNGNNNNISDNDSDNDNYNSNHAMVSARRPAGNFDDNYNDYVAETPQKRDWGGYGYGSSSESMMYPSDDGGYYSN